MIATREFLLRARVDAATLEAWIAAGWLVSGRNGDTRRFAEVDLARAALIRDLQRDMGVNEEGIAIILDLVDQVHGLRWTLRELLSAVHARSGAVRRRVEAETGDAGSSRQAGDGSAPELPR